MRERADSLPAGATPPWHRSRSARYVTKPEFDDVGPVAGPLFLDPSLRGHHSAEVARSIPWTTGRYDVGHHRHCWASLGHTFAAGGELVGPTHTIRADVTGLVEVVTSTVGNIATVRCLPNGSELRGSRHDN